MKNKKPMSQLFKAALEESKKEIDGFFVEDNPHTHYILFLEYVKLSNFLAAEQQIDLEDEKMKEITEHLFLLMPYSEFLANIMTPEYFPDPSIMMDLMLLSPDDLATKKSNLKDGLDQWYI